MILVREILAEIASRIEVALTSLVFLAAAFVLLEKKFQIRKQKVFRPGWWTDLAFYLGQYLIWTPIVFYVFDGIDKSFLLNRLPNFLSAFRIQFQNLSGIFQIFILVGLSDIFTYWGHRAQHHFRVLWRFHSVHHTSEYLDWLAAHREHPVDTLFTALMLNLPFLMVGFSLSNLAGLIAFRGIWAVYIHSNAAVPLGPLKWFIGSPELHHWHHDRTEHTLNFANVSPLMDLMFGTHKIEETYPKSYGLPNSGPMNYLELLLFPFQMFQVRRAPKIVEDLLVNLQEEKSFARQIQEPKFEARPES